MEYKLLLVDQPMNNRNKKVKEVSFKILHQIYPAKKTLQNVKLDIEYVYHCAFSKTFWKDVQHFVQMKTGRMISFQGKHTLIYFRDQDKYCVLSVRKYWFGGHFISIKSKMGQIKTVDYAATIKDIRNKKAAKTYSIMEKFCANDL